MTTALFTAHNNSFTAARRLALAVMLTMTGCGEGQTSATSVDNLATLAQGQVQTDARDGNVCPPDTPVFRGGRCHAACRRDEKLADAGTCLTQECADGYFFDDFKCHEKQDIKFVEYEDYIKVEKNPSDNRFADYCYKSSKKGGYNLNSRKFCLCETGFTLPKIRLYYLYDNGFCYRKKSVDPLNYLPKNSPIKPNCEENALGTCGGVSFSHCTIRSPNGREICVWDLPDLGYPTCRINANNPNEALCERTE